LTFKDDFGSWVNVHSLRVNFTKENPYEDWLKDKQKEFDNELKLNSKDTFTILTSNVLPGYEQKLPYFKDETSTRLGTVEAGFIGKGVSTLSMSWAPTGIPIKFYEWKALQFGRIFESTLTEIK